MREGEAEKAGELEFRCLTMGEENYRRLKIEHRLDGHGSLSSLISVNTHAHRVRETINRTAFRENSVTEDKAYFYTMMI